MPGRVLNFSEFFGKYSSETGEEKNLDSFTQSSTNFEEGFDDATYDQNPLGPNRPVSGSMDATPAQPGETGAPAFSSKLDTSMNAPEEQEIPDESEEIESEESETEETEEVESDEDEIEDSEENDIPEPEAGENPKKEKVEETKGFSGLKGFKQFINESYGEEFGEENFDDEDDFKFNALSPDYDYGDEDWSDEFEGEYGMNPEEDAMDDEFCPNCGTEIGYSPEGASCGCNM